MNKNIKRMFGRIVNEILCKNDFIDKIRSLDELLSIPNMIFTSLTNVVFEVGCHINL